MAVQVFEGFPKIKQIAMGVAVAFSIEDEKKIDKRKKRKWSKNWLINRRRFSHVGLLCELQQNEPRDFLNYLRMDEEKFYLILNLIRPYIAKKNRGRCCTSGQIS